MVSSWVVVTLNEQVDAELNALPVEMRARLARISELIAAVGIGGVGMCVVILRAFVKKTRRTPQREIDLAFKRSRQLKG